MRRVSCINAGCKRSLTTMQFALSQVRCQGKEKKNEPHKVRFFRLWCGQQDLNLHEPNAHKNLNLARLPIPPCPHSFAILAYPRRIVNSFGQFGQNVVNFQKYRPSRRLSSQKNNLDCNNAILHLQHERNHKSTFEKRFYIVCTF